MQRPKNEWISTGAGLFGRSRNGAMHVVPTRHAAGTFLRGIEPVAAAAITALIVATWPVWRWIAHRFADGSGDMWELLAAVTALAVMIRDRALLQQSSASADRNLWLPATLLLAYAASYNFISPLPRALLVMAALGTAISTLWYGKHTNVAICGLLLISLPVMASLNFYLGYPLRAAAGTIAEALLQMNGIAAIREGAQLQWNSQTIAIDAPCSGVRMLWTGAYLSLALAAMMRLSDLRTIALISLSAVVVILANAFRAASLFYVEAGLIQGPEFLHDAIGVAMFALAASTIFLMSHKLAGENHAL